ncbi:MAG: YidC/Oxa1 family membrane protein insertase, partial [Candidatus Acidoferrales bacterium]
MTPISTPDPAQQRMMQLFPLFLTFLFLQVSSGLVLYWTTSNVVGIAQQWFINKRMRERQEAEKLAAREERRMKKKRHKQLPEAPDA